MKGGMMDANVVCPFCNEPDFDIEGLENHLYRYCEKYGGVHAQAKRIAALEADNVRLREVLRRILRGTSDDMVEQLVIETIGEDGLKQAVAEMTELQFLQRQLDEVRGERDSWQREYERESDIVNRVWTALGVATMEQANGKTIWELVSAMHTCGKKNVETLFEAGRKITQIESERDSLREELDRYRWRPIAEIHEDYGPCILIDIEDPGCQEIGSNLDSDFDASEWTHFAPLPSLTNEQAAKLRAELESGRK